MTQPQTPPTNPKTRNPNFPTNPKSTPKTQNPGFPKNPNTQNPNLLKINSRVGELFGPKKLVSNQTFKKGQKISRDYI